MRNYCRNKVLILTLICQKPLKTGNPYIIPTFVKVLVSMQLTTDMKNTCSRVFLMASLLWMSGCSMDESAKDNFSIFSYSFDFSQSHHGWQAGFSDYPAGPDDSVFFELKHAYTDEPAYLAESRKSIMISGNNHSDDLFMYLKKKLDGLKPSAEYTLTFDIEFASNARAGQIGIGGAPGESVFLKVGATAIEPKSIVERGNFIMNIDKGNQADGGADMIKIGNIVSPGDNDGFSHTTVRSSSTYTKPYVVRTNSDGEIWLIVGTDSGYEGVTTLYYTKINVVFSASKQ